MSAFPPPDPLGRITPGVMNLLAMILVVLSAVVLIAFAHAPAPRADRYIGYQAGSFVYVLDQTTGEVVRQCSLGDCAPVKR